MMAGTTNESLSGEVVRRLRASGFQAWLVGGCVRDLLLGRTPKDYDVATDAVPEEVLEVFPGAFRVGAHFGVVLVREGEGEVEVATFRTDHAYEDGRHPAQVVFESDPRQDVVRRDFTVNALLMDPESREVLDYVGGRADLAAGVIRAIGNAEERFREDHLRMLRAVRFAARLGFGIEPETMGAIQRWRELIRRVPAERVRDELVRILTEGAARRGFELLDESGLLEEILPDVARMKGVAQPPEYHPEGDVWVHTLLLLENMREPSAELAMGALLHDVGKPPTFRVAERIRFDGHPEVGAEMAVRIMRDLRFSTEQIRQVESLVRNHLRFKDVPRMKASTLKRFLRLPRFDEHLELHRLDCISSHRMLANHDFVKRKLAELPAEEIRPRPLVNGEDLIAEGYHPGPQFKQMLTEAEDAQLEGLIQTREEALALIRARYRE